VSTGEEIDQWEAAKDIAVSVAFTPDGKTLVAGYQGGEVWIWDVRAKERRYKLDARMWMIRSMALSPDGKTVAAGTVYNTIRLCDVDSGKELFGEYQGHDAQVNAVAFSPNGKILASGGDNRQILLWDTATERHLRHLPGSGRAVAFSPDGRRLASVWTHNDTA